MDKRLDITTRYVNFFYSGLSVFYPELIFGTRTGKKYVYAEKWHGWTRLEFEKYLFLETSTNDIVEAKKTILEWKQAIEKGKITATLPPQDILNKEVQAQEVVEKKLDYETAKLKKKTLEESQKRFEQKEIEKQKTEPAIEAEEVKPVTKEPEKVDKIKKPSVEKPPTPKIPVGEVEKPPTLKQTNIGIQIQTNRKISVFNRAGIRTLARTSPGHAFAMYLHKSGIESKTLEDAAKEGGLQEDEKFRTVVKELELLETKSPVERYIRGKRLVLQLKVGDISKLQKFGLPYIKIARLYSTQTTVGGELFPSYTAGKGFFKQLVGNVGNQLFGKVARTGSERLLTRAGIRLAGKAGGRVVKGITKTGLKGALKAVGLTIPGLDVALIAAEVGSWIKRKLSTLKEKAPQTMMAFASVGFFGVMIGSPLLTGIGATGTIGSYIWGGPGTASKSLSGAKATAGAIATGVLLPSLAGPVVAVLIGIPIIIALILFIINSGAYIVPPKAELLGAIESPYIGVEKTANPEGPFKNGDLPLTINYTVTVRAKKGSLTNIQFENTCRVTRDGPPPSCDAPIPTGDEKPDFISPTKPFIFNYTNEYSGADFQDSFVADIFKVTANAPEQPGAVAATSAVIKIGKPPEECPADWPTDSGYLTQGAYTRSGYSHRTMEAIDIGTNHRPVFAGHSGIVTVANKSSCLGNYIEIRSSCEGRDFISQYAHLEGVSIKSEDQVVMGQTIGLSGNTGECTGGPHLHYRFKYTSGGNPSFPDNPPYMMKPYIPANVPRGCTNSGSCGVSI